MEKPVRSSFQYLSISYECSLAIGNSLNLSEMLQEVIHTVVHKTNAHRGIIWVKNGEQELQPVANAGINIEDVLAQIEIKDFRDVLNQIQKRQQFVLRYKDDKDFLQYCPVLTGKEESVLIVPVTNVAILCLVYAIREIADEPLANLLSSLSKKLSVAIEACTAHENVIKEIQVREKAEKELTKKTEQLFSSEKELQGLYEDSEQARKSLLSILEDVAQKEEALQVSEQNFHDLVENLMDGVAIADENAYHIYVNPKFSEITGYSRDELLNMSGWDFTPPEEIDKLKQRMKDRIAGKTVQTHYDRTIVKKDGTKVPVEMSSTVTIWQGKKRPLAIIHDITERKQAEEKAKEHHKNIELLSETAMQFVEFPADKNIYNFIGEQLRELIGKDSYIAINTIDEEKSILTTRAVLGIGKFTDKIDKLLGRHPVGMTFDAKNEGLVSLSDGKLHLNEEGLYGIFLKTVPKTVCNSLEKLLNIKNIYGIGLTKENELFGTAVIFFKEDAGELKNKQIIETFIKQASIAVQKRQAEKALRIERDNLNNIFEAIEDGIYIVNQHYDIQYVNPVLKRDFGAYEGRKCYEYFHNLTEACPWCKNPDVFAGKTVRWEWKSPHNQKTYDLIDTPLKNPDGSISKLEMFRDITERKQAEVALQESEHRLLRAQEVAHVGDWEFDVKTGVSVWSDEIYSIYGFDSADEIESETMLTGMHPDDLDYVNEKFAGWIKNGEGEPFEYRIVRPDGSIRHVYSPAEVVCDSNGNVVKIYGTALDITDQKNAEESLKIYAEELARSNEELKSLDKMKNEFLSNVSHELKTPLISIKGFSEIVQDELYGPLNDQQKKAMSTVIRNSERLGRLINSILYLTIQKSGRDTYTIHPIDITEIIGNALIDISPQANSKELTIENNTPSDLPLIKGDMDKLTQVFINLFENATKFTPNGGKITVAAFEDSENVHITVSDTGIGISDEVISNLFDKFYQVDASTTRRYGGTGIGLYISKLIVEVHNGEIWAESEEGIGTTFHIMLPK